MLLQRMELAVKCLENQLAAPTRTGGGTHCHIRRRSGQVRPAERLSESAQAMTYLEATQADLWHLVAIRQSPIDGAKQRNPLEIYQDDVRIGGVDTVQQAIAWTAPSAAL